ncbi:MAG: membrane protein insertase YidC [Burkholderiales bacterium]|nr:membrane protein insertase YidC [Burkholderiales bacterium]
METKRFIAFILLSMGILFAWEKWFAPKPVPQSAVASQSAPITVPGTGNVPATEAAGKLQQGTRVKVTTDLVTAEIDTMGGDLRRLTLLKHGQLDDPSKPFVLLEEGGEHTYVAQTGLINSNVANLPTHRTLFTATTGDVKLQDGQDSVSIRLEAAPVAGVKVAKIYTFKRGSYLIDVKYEIVNGGTVPLTASAYYRLLRDGVPPKGSTGRLGASTFTGPAVYTEDSKFRKVQFKDIDKGKADYPHDGKDGWVAMLQHHFASAWLLSPNGGANVCATKGCRFEIKSLGDGSGVYQSGVITDLPTVAPGATTTVDVPLFAGPTETRALEAAAPGLELVRDYGFFTVIAKPMFWALDKIHVLVGNWGWAIILLTLSIKAAFFPLASASYRSMAKMKKLAPRMQRLKEQYGEDRMKFQQATMELYKTEKVNPLGGCLPILIQIPVFMALYATLLSAVELRQAPWMFWIKDLSVADPYFVLPILMAASMFAQSFLNPPSGDPMQDRMMKIMPLIFSFMFFFMPSGLVLYWVVNNVLSIAQQWTITRSVAKADVPAKA